MTDWWETALRLAAEEREQTGQTGLEQLRDSILVILILIMGAVEVAIVLAMAK